MKRGVLALSLVLAAMRLVATMHSGFGLDAFNRAVSAATRENAVFSPVSFEIDAVLFSEAVDALARAKIAESMGVLTGLEAVYRPVQEELSKQEGRKMSFLHARAFCMRDERKAHPAYRRWLQTAFSAEAFTFDFRKGAECWFRSRMDGDMEDFELSDDAASERHYSFFDLVSFRCSWQDPFPTNNTRDIKFNLVDGSSRVVPAMCDLRAADVWKRRDMTILRLPMAESSWFYALLPREGLSVRDIRGKLNSNSILSILSGVTSLTEDGVSHDVAAIVIPKIDMAFQTDLKLAFAYFKLPLTDMERLEKDAEPKIVRQRVRFRLDERGMDAMAIDEKPAERTVKATPNTSRIVLNRPFLFFVFHEPTSTLPVVGQFTGQ